MKPAQRPKSASVARSPEVNQFFQKLRPQSPEYELKLYPAPTPHHPKVQSPSKKQELLDRILTTKAAIHTEKEAISLLKVELQKATRQMKLAGSALGRSEKTKLMEEIGVLQLRIRKARSVQRLMTSQSNSRLQAGCDFSAVMCEACTRLQEQERHLETHPVVQELRRKIGAARGELNRCRESVQLREREIVGMKEQIENIPKLGQIEGKRRAAKKELKRLEAEMAKKLEVRKLLSSSWPGPEVVPDAPVVYSEPSSDISLTLNTLAAWDKAPSIVLKSLQSAHASNLALSVPLT